VEFGVANYLTQVEWFWLNANQAGHGCNGPIWSLLVNTHFR
jgi:hypothetical protein